MGRLTRRAELTRKAESDKVKGIFLYENTTYDTNCFLEGEYGYKAFEKLAAYEDIIDEPEKLKEFDTVYLERCEEINKLNAKLAEYEELEDACVGATSWGFKELLRKWKMFFEVELVKYRQLEEQGLLLQLPVAEGRTVFVIDYHFDCKHNYDCPLSYDEYKCEEDIRCEHERKEYRIKKARFNHMMMSVLGEKVFLTKEEAELALERMKEVQDVN